jgi:predicted Zn-dependent peptidase
VPGASPGTPAAWRAPLTVAPSSPLVRTTRLDCGVTVVTERMPHVESVAIGFWVGVGGQDEPAPLAGVSHFLEHLLFKGTESRTAAAIAEAVDKVGGDMDAATGKDYTTFEVRVLDDCLALGLDLLSDILWAPAFRADEVEAERQVILEELLSHGDEPADAVHDLVLEALFPDHPLGRNVLGEEATVQSITRDEIRAFHAHHYRPANVVVSAAGRLDPDQVAHGVEARFCGLGGGDAPTRRAPGSAVSPVLVHGRPTEQAHVVVGMRSLSADDDDRHALAALNHVLGGGLSSRLFQEIRERRGLAYSVYSYHSPFAGAGALAVYAGTASRHVHEVLELIHEGLDGLAEGGVRADELEIAKGHLRGSTLLGLEESGARMSRIGTSQLVDGEVRPVDDVLARIDALSLDDLARVRDRVLGNDRVLAVIGPFDEREFPARR